VCVRKTVVNCSVYKFGNVRLVASRLFNYISNANFTENCIEHKLFCTASVRNIFSPDKYLGSEPETLKYMTAFV
jgi:hypothetical protein